MRNYHEPIQIRTEVGKPADTSVLVIYTGGTIGMDYDPTGSFLVPFDFAQIMERVPELAYFDFQITVLQLLNPIDSSDISPNHWLELAQIIEKFYDDYDGFVVLHGTDTMAYSASALSFLLENLGKPVIFTGSQLPIAHSRTDGRENFVSALEIAATKKVRIPEVCIFFDNLLLRANRTRKVQSSKFTAFKSENYPPLAVAGITIEYNETVMLSMPEKPLKVHQAFDSRVFFLKIFPGIHRNYLVTLLSISDIQCVVMESYGSGNVPTNEDFLDILHEAIQKGKLIYNISQCSGGRVKQGRYGAGHRLNQIGVIEGADITPEAAITKLMFLLALEKNKTDLTQLLLTSLRGEITIK